ncbi:unnamed protein product, partial [Prorocentrum cordatum]
MRSLRRTHGQGGSCLNLANSGEASIVLTPSASGPSSTLGSSSRSTSTCCSGAEGATCCIAACNSILSASMSTRRLRCRSLSSANARCACSTTLFCSAIDLSRASNFFCLSASLWPNVVARDNTGFLDCTSARGDDLASTFSMMRFSMVRQEEHEPMSPERQLRPTSANHGRPVLKKDGKSKDRDGADRAGWWFGPAVGGGQVWAFHAGDGSTAPPRSGWRVPHDGAVDAAFSLRPGGEEAEGQEALRRQIEELRRERAAFQRQAEEVQRRAQERGARERLLRARLGG